MLSRPDNLLLKMRFYKTKNVTFKIYFDPPRALCWKQKSVCFTRPRAPPLHTALSRQHHSTANHAAPPPHGIASTQRFQNVVVPSHAV